MNSNSQQLRTAIGQYLKQNPNTALKAIKSSGVQLSPQDETNLKSGSLDAFSDQQLAERFNTKALGVLGIEVAGQGYGTHAQGQTKGQVPGVARQAQGQTQGQDKRSRNS